MRKIPRLVFFKLTLLIYFIEPVRRAYAVQAAVPEKGWRDVMSRGVDESTF